MYTGACQVENGLQNSAYKGTCDLTTGFAIVHGMIKLWESTLWQRVKAVQDFIAPTRELPLKAIKRNCHIRSTCQHRNIQTIPTLTECQDPVMSERSMSFSIPEVLKVGKEGLNESLFEQHHGGPQPDTSSGKGAERSLYVW